MARAGRSQAERKGGRVATRQALVDAAAELFHHKGYGATTVPAIVRAAGVGHGTFYEYFGSKRDVLVAITEQAAAASERTPDLDGRPLAEQVRLVVEWYLFNCVENLNLSRIWYVASSLDPEVAEMVETTRRAQVARVKPALEAAGLPIADLDMTLAAMSALLDGFAYRWFVLGDGPGTSAADVLAASEVLTRIVLAALGLEYLATAPVTT